LWRRKEEEGGGRRRKGSGLKIRFSKRPPIETVLKYFPVEGLEHRESRMRW
jgi:hypothetical protein